jgi:O-antigen/teichoic acid export membrane protein
MSRLTSNIVYNLCGQGLLLILGFVAAKYVFRQLGGDALGIIYFVFTLNNLLTGVLGMGICESTVREVSAHSQDDPIYIHNLIRTASLFYWGLYVLLALGIYWCAPVLVQKWVNLKVLDPAMAICVLRILGIASLTALPRSFYGSIARGIERMEFNNLIDVASSGLQQFGIIVILALRGGLLHVAYWISICFGLGMLAYALVCAHFFSFAALVPGVSISVVKRNLGFTSRMGSISLLSVIQTQADKAVVSKFLPIGMFGYYALAYNLVSRGSLITNAISQAAFPSFSALYKANDRAGLMSQYRKLQDLVCFLMVPFFAAIPFAAVPLFTYLLNPEAARMLLLPVTLLSIGTYMSGAANIPYIFSLAVGRPDIAARLNIYALFATLPITVLLVYFWGLNGAGFSCVLYYLFGYAYAVPRFCADCLGIPTLKWYGHLLKVMGFATLTYGTAWIVLEFAKTYSIWALSAGYSIASVAFVGVAYLSIGEELRETVQRLPALLQRTGAVA